MGRMSQKPSRFPTFGDKNIRLYYLLTIFMNGWFILPNWVFYFAQFISIPKIGIIDGLSKLVAIVLEVPSGSFADLVGKKRTLILGNLMFILSCTVLLLATNFVWLLIGNMVMFVGFAFVSGAKEAILYDSMIEIKQEKRYDEVLGKVNSIATFTTIISIFVGGGLFGIHPKLTFIAWMVFSSVATCILLFMSEPISDKKLTTSQEYLSKLQSGVSSIFSKSFFGFILPVLFFSMLIKSYEGVIRQNTGAYFGFTGETFGYMLAIIFIPTLFISYNYGKLTNIFKRHIEYLFVSLYLIGFILILFTNTIIFGLISFLLVYVAQEIAKPYIVSLVNQNTESKHRATSLSTVSLFSEIPYMGIVIGMGFLIEPGTIRYLYIGHIFLLSVYLLRKIYSERRV